MTGKNVSFTNFPNGFKKGLNLRGLPVAAAHPGKIFWVVDSGGGQLPSTIKTPGDGNPGTWDAPFQTIEAAVNACEDGRGDVIYVYPGYAEFGSSWVLTLDKANVTIIGLGMGSGTNGDMPEYNVVTSSTINVTSDDVTVFNLDFDATSNTDITCFDVQAKNFRLESCHFREAAANQNFQIVVDCSGTTDNEADGLVIRNCTFILTDTDDQVIVDFNADVDGFVFENNYVSMGVNNDNPIIRCATGKDLTNCQIIGNMVYRLNTQGDLFIENDTTANTGIVANNLIRHADTAGEVLVDLTGVGVAENYGTASDTASGYALV